MSKTNKFIHLSAPQVILLGFLSVILGGAFILMLPLTTGSEQTTPFLDALFTATSAVCVTGLTTVNTFSHWNFWGQGIILLLIETGGLGFMSIPMLFFFSRKKKVNLSTRILLMNSINLHQISGSVNLMRYILQFSLAIQMSGSLLLAVVFVPRFGWSRGLWYSFFHAVSAFCNAGFDLFGNSLLQFKNDPWILTVLSLLIIAGGLGFLVCLDVFQFFRKKRKHRRLLFHSKIAIATTVILLVAGSLFFLLIDSKPWYQSIFLATTPRTAGFFISDYRKMSMSGLLVTMLLMFIGGTSGSTAGGFKVTSLSVLVIKIRCLLKGRSRAEIYGRTIKESAVSRAFLLLVLYLFLIFSATFILSLTEKFSQSDTYGLESILFEVISALSTVGLSMGLSEQLSDIGKLVIIGLMFIGRVGTFTILFSLIKRSHIVEANYKYPEESVLIG